jgi:hypothetical protein
LERLPVLQNLFKAIMGKYAMPQRFIIQINNKTALKRDKNPSRRSVSVDF